MSGMYICCICDDECGYYTINRINKKTASFAECFYPDTRQSNYFSIYRKKGSPSARRVALGKEPNFAECLCGSTRQSSKLRRVLPAWHSAKFESLQSATRLALGKVFDPVPFASLPVRPSCFNFFCRVRLGTRQRFAECPRKGTRQSRLRR